MSIKLNSVRVVLLVLCCSQLDVLLTACHIFKTDSLSCLLGWAEQLQTLRKLYQGAEMGLTELQNKYRAAKKTAGRYKLWADGKERHIQQEWQRIVVGLQNVLQEVQVKVQTALTDSAVTDSTVTESTVTDSTEHTHLKVALHCGYFFFCMLVAALQIGRSLVRFQMVSMEFFINIILPIALWPWGRLSL